MMGDAQADRAQILDEMTAMAMAAAEGSLALARSLVAEGGTPDRIMKELLLALDTNMLHVLGRYKTERGVEPACKRACWWCCTIPVVVAPLEGLHIEAWLERNGRFTKGLGKRLRAVSEQRWRDRPARCPFLRNKECAIYPVRPVRCRGYYGTDEKVCSAHYLYGHGIVGDVGTLGDTSMLAQGMVMAMMAAVAERKSLLLEDAILGVRDVGGAQRAWERLYEQREVFPREWPCVTLEEYVPSLETVDPVQA